MGKSIAAKNLNSLPIDSLARLAQLSAPGAADWPPSGGRGVVGAFRPVQDTASGNIHETHDAIIK